MEVSEILKHCDHTLLRVDCSADEIRKLCDEALEYQCAAVCVPPCHVAGTKRYGGEKLTVCTVVGFPNGYATPRTKAFEAQDAIRNGADEIDMVANIAMVKDGCWQELYEEIRQVRDFTKGKILKVIIETCLLDEMEKRMMCSLVSTSGADYIKTSTGFSTGGATAEDIRLLRECCDPSLKIKAAGGISTLEDAEEFLRLGADRLGSSRLVGLAKKAMEST